MGYLVKFTVLFDFHAFMLLVLLRKEISLVYMTSLLRVH